MMTAGRRGKQTALAGLKWPNCNFLVRAVSLKESGVWERCQDLSELHMCLCLSHLLTPQQRNLTNKQRGFKRKKKTKQTRGLIIVCVFVRSWVRRDVSSPVAGRTDFQTFISDVRVCVCVFVLLVCVCIYSKTAGSAVACRASWVTGCHGNTTRSCPDMKPSRLFFSTSKW